MPTEFSAERAHRANNVKMILDMSRITADDMIDQLILAGRIHRVEVSGLFYTECENDPRYMEHLDHSVVRQMVAALNNNLVLTWADHDHVPDFAAGQKVRVVTIDVLLTESQAREIAKV